MRFQVVVEIDVDEADEENAAKLAENVVEYTMKLWQDDWHGEGGIIDKSDGKLTGNLEGWEKVKFVEIFKAMPK